MITIKSLLLWLALAIVLTGCTPKQSTTVATSKDADGALVTIGRDICQDLGTKKMWQVGRSEMIFSSEEAIAYAANLSLGGYDDWRLPTREEAFELFRIFYWKNNGECAMKRKGKYWTRPEGGAPAVGHWEDYILCGPEFRYVRSIDTRGYVRAVRP